MKKLTIVRHAKSSWEYNLSDHERPLNARGFKDAGLVSNALKHLELYFDKLISSDAMRAKTTANIFVENLKIKKSICSLNRDLYDFSGEKLIQVIQSNSNDINHLIVFGHNNAITSFVNLYGDVYFNNIPTCGVCILEFDIDEWRNLKQGKTIKTIFPKHLK
ncbi:histidine phosphatase family protein [Tamlana sp. 62-3]|uniref:Histidine phosphatase family protein n=1 Tax=Neotamlana sargassicola TaxID=2883125 RepID=A0A9X1L4Z2_9FLAO|nr:histidine phosphatase family protein [Tamlana sargassicola]MCB4808640.1 histidine phosphatase family protein [Tamlana sargassicola]